MRAAGLEPRVLLGGLQALQLHPYTLLLDCPRTLPFAVSTQPTVHNSAESLASTADTAATAPVTDREDADSFTPDLEEVNPAHYVEPLRLHSPSYSWCSCNLDLSHMGQISVAS